MIVVIVAKKNQIAHHVPAVAAAVVAVAYTRQMKNAPGVIQVNPLLLIKAWLQCRLVLNLPKESTPK